MADPDVDPAAPDDARADGATAQDATHDTRPAEPGQDDADTDGTDKGDAGADTADQTDAVTDDETDTAKSDDTGTSDTDKPAAARSYTDDSTDGGTVPSWWAWVRRHRKPVMLVTGLVVVALVGTLVLVSVLAPGPKDVVQDYLDAIRSGDTKTALEIAGNPDDHGRLSFLSADALADDWTVDAVLERHRRDDEADIDVTISAGERSQQGRFHMIRDDENGWTMKSPFVRLDLSMAGGIDAVELGRVRQKLIASAEPGGTAELLVFPGVYKLYPSLAKRVTFDPPVLIAAPEEAEEAIYRTSASFTLTDAGATAAQQAINDHIDQCAKKLEISPSGCPFNAEDTDAFRGYDYFKDVVWTIMRRPEAHFTTGQDNGLSLVVRKRGTVKLTGTAVPDEPEGSTRTAFTMTCEFGLSNTSIDMTMDGFTVSGARGDAYTTASDTVCF